MNEIGYTEGLFSKLSVFMVCSDLHVGLVLRLRRWDGLFKNSDSQKTLLHKVARKELGRRVWPANEDDDCNITVAGLRQV